MITFERHVLTNGLRVLLHEDRSTPMIAVNLTYDVGSRDEHPERTGFAHLFEHLMFSGSLHAPSYDEPLQDAGGDSNATTNADSTSFYSLLPAENLETILFLEADRMQNLRISREALKIQQQVVHEEFMEILEQPYGDLWHLLAPLAYRKHPYQWPVIGKRPAHILEAKLEEINRFYQRYYGPNNAILSIAGNCPSGKMLELVEKYFGEITPRQVGDRNYALESSQDKFTSLQTNRDIPFDALILAFPMPGRRSPEFFALDLMTDILAEGKSSRLQKRIQKKKKLCTMIDAYVTATMDPGLLVIESRLAEGVTMETMKEAIWEELYTLCNEPIGEIEFTRHLNNLESSHAMSQIHVLSKAGALAYYEQLGRAELINEEIGRYTRLTPDTIREAARTIFLPEKCITLQYEKQEV